MNHVGKLFKNGGSQAVRLPKECRFEGDEVLIRREGDQVILSPIKRGWSKAFIDVITGPPVEPEYRIERPPQGTQKRRARLK
jgi:antitoxin VapB